MEQKYENMVKGKERKFVDSLIHAMEEMEFDASDEVYEDLTDFYADDTRLGEIEDVWGKETENFSNEFLESVKKAAEVWFRRCGIYADQLTNKYGEVKR